MELPVHCASARIQKINASKHWGRGNLLVSSGMAAGRQLRTMREGAADAEAAGHRRRREANPGVAAALTALGDAPLKTTQEKKANHSHHCVGNPLTIQRGAASHMLHPCRWRHSQSLTAWKTSWSDVPRAACYLPSTPAVRLRMSFKGGPPLGAGLRRPRRGNRKEAKSRGSAPEASAPG